MKRNEKKFLVLLIGVRHQEHCIVAVLAVHCLMDEEGGMDDWGATETCRHWMHTAMGSCKYFTAIEIYLLV